MKKVQKKKQQKQRRQEERKAELERTKQEQKAARKQQFKTGIIVMAILAVFLLLMCYATYGALGGSGSKTPEDKVRTQVAKTYETSKYESPVDFELLRGQNEDICAWLDIADTEISYPVLKNDTDEMTYLDHDSLGEYSVSGSLFIDSFNSRNFDDPVTVIYGHHMKDGEYFGNLQSIYSNKESFNKHKKIRLFLPDEGRDYEVFAAVPYSKIHILYNYDFSDELQFYVFFDRVFAVRSLAANFDRDAYPEFGEKVLILSTCLEGDNTQRYLVMAKEVSTDDK